MSKRPSHLVISLVLLTGLTAGAFGVDQYIDPANISATASSVNYQLEAIYSCNGNGLTGDLHTNDIGGAPPAPGQGTMWLAEASDPQPSIQYEFDKPYSLNNMWVWNYNQITGSGGDRTGRGTKECTIECSIDGENWTQLGDVHTFAKADGSDSYAHNTEIDFGAVKAKFVKITAISDHGGGYPGLSEVRFYIGNSIGFETETSADLESVSPAVITVVLNTTDQSRTYTVDYAVTGGTATRDLDYTLADYCLCDFDDNNQVNILDIAVLVNNWLTQTPGNTADITGDDNVNFQDFALCALKWLDDCTGATLVFNPGDTSKAIVINIIDDGLDEEDETIELTLSNVSGGDVELGTAQHTYTIIDPQPKVAFDAESSSGLEDVTPALIAVTLSHVGDQTITVDYALTGGTASGDGVDYTLAAGTLQFEPGQLTQHISVDIVDDDEQESPETIELTLSNPTNATLGQPTTHTYTILDNEQGTVFDGMVWYFSGDNPEGRFEVNAAGQLQWRNLWPPDHVIVQLPEQRFSEPGDVVEISYWYKGEGGDNIVSGDRGTGDIRTGLFDSNGSCHAAPPDLWYTNDCFIGYIGYRIGFSAHASGYGGHIAKRIYPFEPSLLQSAEGPYGPNSGQKDINAFGLPRGQWALWTLRLERTSSSRVVFTVTCNGRTAQLVDDNAQHQPQKIDAFGMYFANVRDYTLVSLATEQPSP